jgi:hypothetical protein
MSLQNAIRLVKSLSATEKRHFKLTVKKYSGQKDYLDLFDIIDGEEIPDAVQIENRLILCNAKTSIEHVSRYLIKSVTDCLIESRMEKDSFFQLLQGIMRIKVLQERALPEEAYRLLRKTRAQATQKQQHDIELMTYRAELDYLTSLDFYGVDEKLLIETQMRAREILKNMNHIQDHHSLYEMIKYRLTYSGKISSEDEKKKMNDLMLSEMVLVSGKSKKFFTAQKLHLLFQSIYFSNIGDHQTALKVFQSLCTLLEQNLGLLGSPPTDYLSTINGIIDSLLTLKKYDEINYYINKLKELDENNYPENFSYQVRKSVAAVEMAVLVNLKEYKAANTYMLLLPAGVLKSYRMANEEKQWEVHFYCALTCFGNNDLKKAHAYLGETINFHKSQPQLLICKASRLLNIILYYERGDVDYIGYEIRAYSRQFKEQVKLLQTEVIVLKLLKAFPDKKRKKIAGPQLKALLQKAGSIQHDRYERQLLKYFDFMHWCVETFSKKIL